jgi:hypothetical protein
MSEPLSEFIIVFAFGALCFGCGYLTAFIVTRTRFRNQMIKRGAARHDSETGKWEWEKPASRYRMPRAASFPAASRCLSSILRRLKPTIVLLGTRCR